MIITRNWLAQYLDIDNYSDQALMLILNKIGIEIDHYQKIKHKNLQLALVTSVSKLAGTDYLNLCRVQIKNGKQFEVICGAPNVTAGHFAIYAPEGACLSNGLRINAKKIKNVVSFGMLCSLQELGFNFDQKSAIDGIVMIDPDQHPSLNLKTAPNDIAAAWGINDTIFEVNLLWDRPDYTSAWRILAELSNFLMLKPKIPFPVPKKRVLNSQVTPLLPKPPLQGALSWLTPVGTKWPWSWNDYFWTLHCGAYLENDDFISLARYRLMLTTGLPLMVIPWSKDNQPPKIAAIKADNQRNDHMWSLVDFKTQKPYLIFGEAIGCARQQAGHQQNLLLWVTINFQAQAMRQQQKSFNTKDLLWERLIRPLSNNYLSFIYDCMQKFLNQELPIIMNINNYDHNFPILTLNPDTINKILGTNFTKNSLLKILNNISPDVSVAKEGINVIAPVWRSDLIREIDWIAETGRMFDFNNIQPKSLFIPHHPINANNLYQMPRLLITKINNFWSQHRFYETINLNLINQEQAGHFNFYGYGKPLVIKNPLSSEHAVLQQSLIPHLLKTIKYNSRNGFKNKTFYTIGQVHTTQNTYTHLAWVIPEFTDKIDLKKAISGSFYTVKTYCLALIKDLGYDVKQLDFKQAPPDTWCHPYQTFTINFKNDVIGVLGAVNLAFKQKNKLNQIYFGELNLERLQKLNLIQNNSFKMWSRFQKTSRDLTIIISAKLNFAAAVKIIKQESTVINVIAQDAYRDPDSFAQKITIRCEFNTYDHQLKEVEINQIWNNILNKIRKLGMIDE